MCWLMKSVIEDTMPNTGNILYCDPKDSSSEITYNFYSAFTYNCSFILTSMCSHAYDFCYYLASPSIAVFKKWYIHVQIHHTCITVRDKATQHTAERQSHTTRLARTKEKLAALYISEGGGRMVPTHSLATSQNSSELLNTAGIRLINIQRTL